MRLAQFISRYAVTTRCGKLLRLPFELIPSGMVLPVVSGLNKGLAWVVKSSVKGCWLGVYETEKQAVIRRLVRSGMTVFDVGANAGFFTLAFSRLVGPNGRVWAFEPLAGKVDALLKHVRMNTLLNVHVVQSALADRSGVVGFDVCDDGSMGSLGNGQSRYHVPILSIDELVDAGIVPIPGLIKMDVEGAEFSVLKGAEKLVKRDRPVLLIACHSETQRRSCLEFLWSNEYRVYYLDGREHQDGQLIDDEIYALPDAG